VRMCQGSSAATIEAYAGRMNRSWGFAVYAIVATVHLVSLFVDAPVVGGATKVLLMPALLVALVVALPRVKSEIAVWAGLGIAFSWAGDALLADPDSGGFVVGLGAFLLAHAAYLVLFIRPMRTKPITPLALAYVVWWIALVGLLAPHLGALLIPVAIYGLVLGASATFALGTNRFAAIGALIFTASDTVLAFKLFHPDFSLWQPDFVIMLLYVVGQGLIIFGAVTHARGRAARGAVVA
jgi:uncharacterized membrane protein YhhN